ncbi:MAG TPA: HAMP domain-containing sensor histidine kinase [Longimicrobiaceae bacterium]|nr:HAMP domain-containing sensor histidine kinase [Longimicrobiaceae bacterium]
MSAPTNRRLNGTRLDWRMLAPLLVAVTALVALVFVSVVMQRRTDLLRDELSGLVEPARAELNSYQAAISKEMAAQRGFMLFPDTAFVHDEEEGRREEGFMDIKVDELVSEIGGTTVASWHELQAATLEWRRSPGDPTSVRSMSRDEGRRALLERQVLFEKVLDTAGRLEDAIEQTERERSDEIDRLGQLRLVVSLALVLVALGALVGLVRVAGRLRALSDEARMLAEESDRRRRALEAVAEEKGRFLRGITHDLKNPLGAIDAYAQLLESGVRGPMPPEQLDFVARIRRVTGECVGIIQDLLHLAVAETTQIPIERGPTELRALVRESVEDYRAAIHASGFELALQLAERLSPVHTDGRRVREILGNLLSNALKHTPSGGRITVELRHGTYGGRPCALLSVADTGPGIAHADRERIFGEFQRLHPGGAHGSGIGLAISRQIARMLDGDLSVGGTPGEGAVFTLSLPLETPAAAPAPRTSGLAEVRPAPQPGA